MKLDWKNDFKLVIIIIFTIPDNCSFPTILIDPWTHHEQMFLLADSHPYWVILIVATIGGSHSHSPWGFDSPWGCPRAWNFTFKLKTSRRSEGHSSAWISESLNQPSSCCSSCWGLVDRLRSLGLVGFFVHCWLVVSVAVIRVFVDRELTSSPRIQQIEMAKCRPRIVMNRAESFVSWMTRYFGSLYDRICSENEKTATRLGAGRHGGPAFGLRPELRCCKISGVDVWCIAKLGWFPLPKVFL